MFHTQQRTLNTLSLICFITAVFSIFCLPIIVARNLDNSKNELLDSSSSSNSKINNQYNNGASSAYYTAKHNFRSMLNAPKDYQQKLHSKTPLNLDLMDFLLEYGDEERSKRFDDYGHMRFGKRGGEEQFDDYGHMRFGRST